MCNKLYGNGVRGVSPEGTLETALGPADDTSTVTARPTRETFGFASECPFHTVMRQVAEAAVLQHVLHLEGEVLPRQDLVENLERWQQVYRLVRIQVCPATRDAALTADEVHTLLDIALPCLMPPDAPQPLWSRLSARIATCAKFPTSRECPLGLAGDDARHDAAPEQEPL